MWPETRRGGGKLGLSTGGNWRRQVALWAVQVQVEVPKSRTNAQLIEVRRLNETAVECAQEQGAQGPGSCGLGCCSWFSLVPGLIESKQCPGHTRPSNCKIGKHTFGRASGCQRHSIRPHFVCLHRLCVFLPFCCKVDAKHNPFGPFKCWTVKTINIMTCRHIISLQPVPREYVYIYLSPGLGPVCLPIACHWHPGEKDERGENGEPRL